MAINFPASPSLNDTFTSGGVTYTWDGTVWAASGSAAFASKAGDTFTGNVEISTGIDLNTDGTATLAGPVGIANTAMASLYAGGNNLVVGDGVGDEGMTIYTGNNKQGIVAFADGTTGGAQQYAGYLLYDHNSDYMALATTGSERLRIDSSGNVGLGTSAPNSYSNFNTLTLNGTTGGVVDFESNGTLMGQIYCETDIFRIDARGSTTPLKFVVNSAEAMRIDTSQRLLLGTTTEGHANADDLTIATSGDTGITIRSSASGYGNIFFSDATSGSGEYVGYLQYNHTDDILYFGTAAAQQMRIDSSGNLNFSQEAASNPYPEQKLKWSNDSTTTNGFYISQDTSRNGRVWHEQGLDVLFGTNDTERMRILSGGGITFNGDTATANALDDYEEGTWTPEFAGDGGTLGSYTYSAQSGTYTKVGNVVTAICYLENITQVSAGNEKAQVTGLPFANGDSYPAIGPVTLGNFTVSTSDTATISAHVESGSTAVKFRRTRGSASAILVNRTDMTSGSADIWFSITYRVA